MIKTLDRPNDEKVGQKTARGPPDNCASCGSHGATLIRSASNCKEGSEQRAYRYWQLQALPRLLSLGHAHPQRLPANDTAQQGGWDMAISALYGTALTATFT